MTDMLIKSRELLDEAKKRRTYREFLPEKVDLEVIKNCILTGATAPNGADKQPWHFVVVTGEKVKGEVRRRSEEIEKKFYESMITDQWQKDLDKLSVTWEKPFLTEAPCLIVIFKEMYKTLEDGSKDKNYYVNESVGIATGMLINALNHAGYASLTYTPAPMKFLTEMFNRPSGESAEMILVVGKPSPDYELPKLTKKSIEEICDFI